MIYKEVFELNKEEIKMVNQAKDKDIRTTWCQQGAVQEKGKSAEILISNLLTLCDDVVIFSSKRSTELDEVLKVDIVLEQLEEPKERFAFQIKSSLTGAKIHYEKYAEDIIYNGECFRTPWCLIVDGSLTNRELLELLMYELMLGCSIDFDFLDEIEAEVLKDNNKAISKSRIRKLTRKELKALRLLYCISAGTKTYYFK